MRLIILATLLVIGCRPAFAQDNVPQIEIAAVYTAIPRFWSDTCHGAGASLTFNVRSWFGVVGDVGACGRQNAAVASDTQFTYLVGPRVSYRRTFTPYAQILVGGAHASANSTGNEFRGNAFAMTFGVGVDLHITDRFAIRLIQPEYLRTTRDDFRVQTGVVFALK